MLRERHAGKYTEREHRACQSNALGWVAKWVVIHMIADEQNEQT